MYDFKWQSEKINEIKRYTDLHSSCTLNHGIVKLFDDELMHYKLLYRSFQGSSTMFIPASGSGSRMFQPLNEYIQSESLFESDEVIVFFQNLEKFAFYELLPIALKKKQVFDKEKYKEIIEYLVKDNGLNFGNVPKGLLPFHRLKNRILNPFQEQVLQGVQLNSEMSFHFTIQEEFETDIRKSIENIFSEENKGIQFSFSNQDKRTDSYVFDKRGALLQNEDGNYFKKPSGHGALLENLNRLDADLIFIKNIDNVQHYSKSSTCTEYFSILAGLLLTIKKEVTAILSSSDYERLNSLNKRFHLFHENEMPKNNTELQCLLSRPIRVCGMVLNEGAPGGGPFWVKTEHTISKQIVESAEVSHSEEQQEIFNSGTHFNPVFMVLDTNGDHRISSDLEQFGNSNRFLKVHKKQGINDIQFIERPGLWNGSMHHWTTVFVEVPSCLFSPVKNILDLLNSSHSSEEA